MSFYGQYGLTLLEYGIDGGMKKNMAQEKALEEGLKQEEVQNLKNQLILMNDLNNLQNENYFRQQMLIQLERIAVALEKGSSSTEDSEDEEVEDE